MNVNQSREGSVGRQRLASELLCERCGYVLDGSPVEGACAECGLAIRESLAERRPGSAWQRKPSPWSWMATGWGVVLHPARTFREVRLDPSLRWRDEALLWDNVVAAAFLGLAVLLAGLSDDGAGFVLNMLVAVVFTPVVQLPLLMLTELERIGIGFVGRRRGWRVDRVASGAVCAHASVGWVAATVLGALGYLVSWPVYEVLRKLVGPGGFGPGGAMGTVIAELVEYVPAALPLVGFGVGMVVFESLVWIGVRGCRFANRPMVVVAQREQELAA